jgi:taurine dioxygenase
VALEIRPLSAALGAEVAGIDLNQLLAPGDGAALKAAFAEHLVLVVRGQKKLTVEGHTRFCALFGPLGKRSRPADTRAEGADDPPDVMFVSNRKKDGRFIGSLPEGEMMFHIDQCYVERPARATCLYAIVVPDVGGNTLFGNLCAAYDALPDDLRAIVDGHRALNVFSYDSTSRDQVASSPNARKFIQPMVVRNAVTGRKALYVNRLMTFAIEGLDDDAGREVLDRLFDHQERAEFVYSHKWRKDDLLIWDNQCTVHARADFDPTKERHMRRFTVDGEPLRAA